VLYRDHEYLKLHLQMLIRKVYLLLCSMYNLVKSCHLRDFVGLENLFVYPNYSLAIMIEGQLHWLILPCGMKHQFHFDKVKS
jgi:hypothetical protein